MNLKSRNTVRTSLFLPEDARVRIQALAAASDALPAWVMRHAILTFLGEHAGRRELPLCMPGNRRSQAW